MLRTPILIADDYPIARRGFRDLLEHQAEWEVVGEAVDGHDAIAQAGLLRPKLVILDEDMPHLDGLQSAFLIRRALPRTRLLILATHDEPRLIEGVLDATIDGFVLHSSSESNLLLAIKSVLQGKTFVKSAQFDPTQYSESTRHGLTTREEQVLRCISEGLTSKQVAGMMNLSVRTVENHRAKMMRRLDAHSFAEVLRHAIRQGVIQV